MSATPGTGDLRTLLRNMRKAEEAKKKPAKVGKSKLTAKDKKILESLGLSTKRITKATIKAEWKRTAKALPLAQRQLILDLFRQGNNIGDVAAEARVDSDTVCGVLDLNTDYIPILRTESR